MRKFLSSLILLGTFLVLASHGVYAKSDNAPVCPGPADKGSARCHARVVTDTQGKPKTSTTPSGYGPAQFHGAYNLPPTSSTLQTIAIVDAYDDPYALSDLNTYSSYFHIPTMKSCPVSSGTASSPCFQKVNQNGGISSPSVNSGWALEISLDVQTAHAICQNCNILLVEAYSSSYTNLMAAVDTGRTLGANVISNSYGSGEFVGEVALDSHFSGFPGAITFSSGDSGYGAEYPASSPYVTAVGGTSLYLNSNNTWNSEVAWSGSGSGCSAYEFKPNFQTDPLCSNRTVADVSADADPNTGAAVYDSVKYQGRKGWFQVGGTSLSSPLIAGVYALSGNYGGSANSLPYSNTSFLRDITSGSNGNCGTYLCTAVSGYDGPTGLGTPNSAKAF